MRPELNKKNADKVFEIVNKLRDEHGIEITPNRVVNFIIEHAQSLEVQNVVTIGFDVKPLSRDGHETKSRRVHSVLKKNWTTDF